MINFIVRFPQHDPPIAEPCGADYRDAAAIFFEVARDRHLHSTQVLNMVTLARRFHRVARMYSWIPRTKFVGDDFSPCETEWSSP